MGSPINLKDLATIESFSGLSLRYLKENRVLPFKRQDDRVLVAMAEPTNLELQSALEVALGASVEPVEAREEDILEVIQAVYEPGSPMAKLVSDLGAEEMEMESEETSEIGHLRDMAREAPTIQLVNLLLLRAIQMGASDIHLEPFENDFRVRYRKDGILYEVESPPKGLQAVVLSRLKIMARLDIAERRLPQDGRFRLKVKGHDIDFRVSTLPTLLGESMVIRILDRETVIFNLNGLGFPDRELRQFTDLIHKPYGMILVTGPTGSGKTTTLYAALELINSPEKKIITIEDPVEYRLAGVTQMQVKPSIGLTFAKGLRHIVRQDPDVVLVGEIRDRETADIAVHAALTGHLVFSTLHTNDAPGAATRLKEMGIEEFLLASAVLGILAQRLVRLICPECRAPLPPEVAAQELRRAPNGTFPGSEVQQLFVGSGCPACANTGYQARTGIYELLLIDDAVRQLILQRADASALRQVAIRQGMLTLATDGWSKVAQGLTTVQEVLPRYPGIDMATFHYRATDASGSIIQGSLEAREEKQVVLHLHQGGLIPLRIDQEDQALRWQEKSPLLRRGRIASRDVVLFTQELAALLKAGLPLDRSLQALEQVTSRPAMKAVLAQVLGDLRAGKTLADALSRHQVFSPLYVSLVQAGETGGFLEEALSGLGDYLKTVSEFRSYLLSALIYPMILAGVGSLSLILMLLYVVPRFETFFKEMGQTLFWSTRLLIGLSQAFRSYWWLGGLLLVIAVFALQRLVKSPEGQFLLDRVKMQAPFLGDLSRRVAAAFFAKTLGTLLVNGVPMVSSLRVVIASVNNRYLAKSLTGVLADVEKGQQLSGLLKKVGMFPELFLQMVAIGEETGHLADMLLSAASSLENDARSAVRRLLALLEPVLILVTSLVVAFIIVSLLLPILNLYEIQF